MAARLFALVLAALLLTAAPGKKSTLGTARGENEDLILTATIYVLPTDVKELIGDDLGGHYIVAEIKVEPKYGKEVAVERDDFVLRTDKDGEKAKPYVANQIAGRESLIVTREKGEDSHRPGISLGGLYGGMGAGGSSDNGNASSTLEHGAKVKENPIEKVLDQKILVEKKTTQPVSGLLYFPMEKQKMKELELNYGGKENRISLRFKPVQ